MVIRIRPDDRITIRRYRSELGPLWWWVECSKHGVVRQTYTWQFAIDGAIDHCAKQWENVDSAMEEPDHRKS